MKKSELKQLIKEVLTELSQEYCENCGKLNELCECKVEEGINDNVLGYTYKIWYKRKMEDTETNVATVRGKSALDAIKKAVDKFDAFIIKAELVSA